MKSYSEIETTVKRASRAIGYSWGVSEEIGKSIRLLEFLGIPGVKNLNSYFKVYNKNKFQNISLISKKNQSPIQYCPLSIGINFLDQAHIMDELIEINFNNVAFPLLTIPFISRASYLVGKKIFLKIDEKNYLLNFNESIYSNFINYEILEKSNNINIKFVENKNLFSEDEWRELYKLSENTFVEENDELKKKAAGAGLTDND